MSHPLWSNKPADLEMEIKRCKEAGITCMRTDFGFGAIAGEKGKYNFTRYDNLVDKMGAAGIEILPILEGYDWEVAGKRSDAVPLYRHPEEWRAYIRAVAEHYKGKIHAYEIWNEQDGGFWKPSPNAAQYVSLLKIAFEEIKKVDPEATVIVGGLCGWNVDFLRDIYLNGGKDYFAWETATATATEAPTIGLLPMPISPIISTCAGTLDEPANCASPCMRPMVSVMP